MEIKAMKENTCERCGASEVGLWIENGLCFECRREENASFFSRS